MSHSTIMHRGVVLIISFAMLFVLTSCGRGNQVIDDSYSAKVNILELDETDVVNAMNFDHYAVSLIHNTNEEVPINRTVDVYGVLITENDCDTVKSALTNRFAVINLYSNGEKIITANEYTVDAITAEDSTLFTLHLVVDSSPYIDGTHSIEKIEFIYSSGTTVSKEVEAFTLTFYHEEQNKTNIIESPTANAVAIAKDEFFVVNYLFLCANRNANDSFNVSFDIPENIEKVVDASLMEIAKDEDMTETALAELYLDLTPEQRNSLNVYKISVSFTKTTDKGFILQLLFATDILGEHQYMGAFCPLIIQ